MALATSRKCRPEGRLKFGSRRYRAPVPRSLDTARLRLRAWRAHEAEAVLGLLGDDATMGTMRAGRVHSLDEAEEWLRKRLIQQEQQGLTMWAVERQLDSVVVGACGLFPKEDRLELAYIIDHRYRLNGYAAEAAGAAVATGQAVRPGARIYATIRPDNEGSIRVAETVGLEPVGRVEDDFGSLVVYEL